MILSVLAVVYTKRIPYIHRMSRFDPAIADTEVPNLFQTPIMKRYDGTTDPEELVVQYM